MAGEVGELSTDGGHPLHPLPEHRHRPDVGVPPGQHSSSVLSQVKLIARLVIPSILYELWLLFFLIDDKTTTELNRSCATLLAISIQLIWILVLSGL